MCCRVYEFAGAREWIAGKRERLPGNSDTEGMDLWVFTELYNKMRSGWTWTAGSTGWVYRSDKEPSKVWPPGLSQWHAHTGCGHRMQGRTAQKDIMLTVSLTHACSQRDNFKDELGYNLSCNIEKNSPTHCPSIQHQTNCLQVATTPCLLTNYSLLTKIRRRKKNTLLSDKRINNHQLSLKLKPGRKKMVLTMPFCHIHYYQSLLKNWSKNKITWHNNNSKYNN